MNKHTWMLWGLAVLVVVAGQVSLAEDKTRMSDEDAAALIESQAATDPLAVADDLSDFWRHMDAVHVLETNADTTQPDVLWRLSRSHIDYGEQMEDQKAALPHYELAVEEAERLLELEPMNAEGHLRIATASGRIALQKGPFSAAGLVKDTYRHAHLAKTMSDSIPVAYFILGRTHRTLMEKSGLARRLAGLTFASDDSIAFYFQRAIEEAKGNMIQAYVEYGEYLILDADNPELGKTQLEAALQVPIRDEHDSEALQKARELLSKL